MSFERHVAIRARCAKRWRGANFDAAAAQGNVGAAVAEALGVARPSKDLEGFLSRAFVKAFDEPLDRNPALEFDASRGESWEFHVGLRQPVDDATFARVEKAAREAVASSRGFSLA